MATAKKSPEPTADDLQKKIEESAKMYDVAKPGKTAPNPTSRPIIVNHAPMIEKDPMVREKEAEKAEEKSQTVVEVRREKKIMPLTAEEKEAPAVDAPKPKIEAVEPAELDTPKDETPQVSLKDNETSGGAEKEDTKEEVPKEEPKEEPVKEEEKAPDPEPEEVPKVASSHSAEVDAIANEAASKKGAKKDQDELAARLAEAEKLVASKQYYVPIGQASRRRSHRLVVLSLILTLVLAAAVVNFAVDAEVMDIGVSALTDLL